MAERVHSTLHGTTIRASSLKLHCKRRNSTQREEKLSPHGEELEEWSRRQGNLNGRERDLLARKKVGGSDLLLFLAGSQPLAYPHLGSVSLGWLAEHTSDARNATDARDRSCHSRLGTTTFRRSGKILAACEIFFFVRSPELG